MNEITLSNNLSQIELEIRHHQKIAGQSIWEIGRRLNHVKENNLTHGQFGEWVKMQGIDIREAQRMMKVSKELPNTTTWSHLGSRVLYLLTTLPEEEKQEQIEKIEQGDSPTVRELEEVKKKLRLKDQALEAVKHVDAKNAVKFLENLSYDDFTKFEIRETPKQKELIALERG